MKKVKVYIYDSGDGDIYTQTKQDILDMISSDLHDMQYETDELNYTITFKWMTEDEYAELPEWS